MVRLADREHCKLRPYLFDKPRRNKASSGARADKLVEVFCIVEKREVAWTGRIQRRDVGDNALERHAVSRPRPCDLRDFAYRQRLRTFEELRSGHQISDVK